MACIIFDGFKRSAQQRQKKGSSNFSLAAKHKFWPQKTDKNETPIF
jgi:hypothetical protein